jgi:fibronectin-binding autotransporter adhesin
MLLGIPVATVTFNILSALPAAAATLAVTNCNDAGAGSLRQAVSNAAAGDTVSFALSPACSPITLTSGVVDITRNLAITGPGANLAVSGNHTSEVFQVDQGTTVTIAGLTIENGTELQGGGIANFGTLNLNASTVSGNTTPANGGGIANFGTLNLNASTVSGNTSFNGAGIISIQGTLNLNDSTVSGNTATDAGGGIANFDTSTLNLNDSTVSGNTALQGGGIVNVGLATLTHVTLSGNTAGAGQGGGIYNSGSIIPVATIVANSGSGLDCVGTSAPPVTDGGYNLDDDGSCGFSGTSLSQTPAGLDPAGLQNNGGPTLTIAPVPPSAAINHVTLAADCTGNDQRGVPWPTPCDIGAVQVTGCPVGLTAYHLSAVSNTGNFRGLFCLNASGRGTYTQGSVTGTGTITTSGGVTRISAYGTNLALVGQTNGSTSSFRETAPLHTAGTFTLS